MAFYGSEQSNIQASVDLKNLGEAFGLQKLDSNYFAEDQGFTAIRVSSHQGRGDYIPYTNREIKWHTDGYYNPPEKTIRSLLLHCDMPAIKGGVNQVLDPEIVFLQLMDESEDWVLSLMDPEAMTIPPHIVDGVVHREESRGPVFHINQDGALLMRYTARTRNIVWKDDPQVRAAVHRLEELMDSSSKYVFETTLQTGQGLISSNVLHNRSGFEDDPEHPRLFYRLRYYDRIRGLASFV